MTLDAGKIYDANMNEFNREIADPQSNRVFQETYINLLYTEDRGKGSDFDNAYGAVVGDYIRGGFVVGFKAAVRLMMDCARN